MKREKILFKALLILILPLSLLLSGTGLSAPIKPPHVYQKLSALDGLVSLMCEEMGKSCQSTPVIAVSGATPREVYSLVRWGLLERANRFTLEMVQFPHARAIPPTGTPKPTDVFQLVSLATDQLQLVADRMGGIPSVSTPPLDWNKKPTDVLSLAMEVSAKLDVMLATKISPSEVYQLLSVARQYVRILDDGKPQELPPLVRKKRPGEIYQQLQLLFAEIEQLSHRRKLNILTLSQEGEGKRIGPGHVYNLAALTLAELKQLVIQAGKEQDIANNYPGRKSPSHVNQLVQLLLSRVRTIQ